MKLAYLFPGQGSQAVGMGKTLLVVSPAARAVFEEADAALGEKLSTLILEGPAEDLKRTTHTQPAILTMSIACLRALEERGVKTAPACVAGHSLGEYSALVAAGAIAFSDAVRAVRARGAFMQEAVPEGEGAMAAVLGLDAAKITAVVAEYFGGNRNGLGASISGFLSISKKDVGLAYVAGASVLGLLFFGLAAFLEYVAVPWQRRRITR